MPGTPDRLTEHQQISRLLAWWAAGTLSAEELSAVSQHTRACPTCAMQLASWRAVRAATRLALPTMAPNPDVLNGILARITQRPAVGPGLLLALLCAQAPLVRRQVWSASALVLSLGFFVTLLNHHGGGTLLETVAPVVAAAGIAVIYGPENDPSLELALATPTPARLILLARLTIVFGYDLVCATLVSVGLAAMGDAPGGLGPLIFQWLGPMLLLSAMSLWLSLAHGPLPATGVPLALWAMKVGLVGSADHQSTVTSIALALSSTNVVTVGMAALITTLVVVQMPRSERVA
jgi:hypothetical protein